MFIYYLEGGYFSLVFVYLFVSRIAQKLFTKVGGKVVHGLRKKPLDFGGNLDLHPEVRLNRISI